jgi:hypothetical protein
MVDESYGDYMSEAEKEKIAGAVRAELARRAIRAAVLVEPLQLRSSAMDARLNGDVAFTYTELRRVSEFLRIPLDVLTGDAPPNTYDTESRFSRQRCRSSEFRSAHWSCWLLLPGR